VGLNYEINKSNTLRFAYQSFVNDHFEFLGSLAPSEVAGFPSVINSMDGTKIKELGFAWESQWNPRTFTVLRLEAYRVDDPEYAQSYDVHSPIVDLRTERFEGSFTLNRLLTSSIGLSAGISGKLVSMETGDFSEIDGNAGLSYMHSSGWVASIKDTVVCQDLAGLGVKSYTFNLVNISLGRYFANKRGFASLDLTNIFNQHFNYQAEPYALYYSYPFYPDREIMFRLRLFF
jgi:hypothetical protein